MQKTWRSHLMVAYSLAILAFLYLPLLILAMYSFNESRINAVWTGFTFNWYEALFQNRRVLEALTNSLFYCCDLYNSLDYAGHDSRYRAQSLPIQVQTCHQRPLIPADPDPGNRYGSFPAGTICSGTGTAW